VRVKGLFTGTVTEEPKIVSIQGKKPFLAFQLESPDSYNQWPNRLKVVCFDKDLEAAKAKLFVGAVVCVDGDMQAEAYISEKGQNAGKPVGVLKMACRVFEVFGASQGKTEAPRTAPARKSAPPATAPAADPGVDDEIPF
jgi:single-stranded DNA-binding protein